MHRELINPKLMSNDEIDWLNEYHKNCLKYVGPILEEKGMKQGLDYLKKHTQPLSHSHSHLNLQ